MNEIKKLRANGSRKIWSNFDRKLYAEKLEGSLLGRLAGCTLGAPVEFWDVKVMEDWAAYIGDKFPPVDYWTSIKNPSDLRYSKSACKAYTRPGINGVPVDDDITYTILGLLIAEDFGIHFTTDDVGKAWQKYLPYACTAEDVALKNLESRYLSLRSCRCQ